MNRTFKLALSAVLGMALVMPAFAQDNFPDVPDNHWAYEAIGALKEAGCLVGYPDGLYRPNRPMSRAEFAAATYACWQKMMSMWGDIDSRLKALEGDTGGDTQSLADAIKALRADVDGMKGWGNRVADLERLTKEFRSELTALGADVKKMQEGLSSLEDRVSALEKIKPAVDIHGNIDFLVLAGHSTDGNAGLTQGNRVVGIDDNGFKAGLAKDFTVLHEAAFMIKGTNEEGPKWETTIVAGNMLGGGGFVKGDLGNFNTQNAGLGFQAGSGDVYINTASVTFDTAMLGQGFNAKIGRVGHQVGSYLWKRSDFTTYFKNDRWDNGDFYFDGGILSFDFGQADLKVFGGSNSGVNSINNVAINPIGAVDRTLGVQLMFPVGDMGGVNLAYLWHDSDTFVAPGANRLNVFGGELKLKFDQLELFGAYSQANTANNNSNVNDDDNTAYDVRLAYDGGSWGARAGYKSVEQNFFAAGSWGRIGNQWSPRNIKGFYGGVWFDASEQMTLWAKGQFMEPEANTAGFNYTNFDKMNAFMVGLDYQIAENWGAMFSYEDVRFDAIGGGGDPTQRWYTLGFNYGMSANSSVAITYTFSDLDFKGANGAALDPTGRNRYKGGLLGTQVSVKF